MKEKKYPVAELYDFIKPTTFFTFCLDALFMFCQKGREYMNLYFLTKYILLFFICSLKDVIIIQLEPTQDKKLIKSFKYDNSSVWDSSCWEKTSVAPDTPATPSEMSLLFSEPHGLLQSVGPQFVSHVCRCDCHTHSKIRHRVGNCGDCLSKISLSAPLSADTTGLAFKLHRDIYLSFLCSVIRIPSTNTCNRPYQLWQGISIMVFFLH